MALIQCQECKREISDSAEVCPHCGYRVQASGVGKPDAVRRSKKKMVTTCVTAVAVVIGVIAGICVHNSNERKAEAAEYQERLNLVVEAMGSGASGAETGCGLIHDVWYNTIYEKSDSATDQFTKKSSGRFYSDFNDSLKKLFQNEDFNSLVDAIKNNQATVEDLMKKLANPPSDYQAAYDAIWNLYEVYLDLTEMVISPTGSLQSYTQGYNTADADFVKYYKAASIYTS